MKGGDAAILAVLEHAARHGSPARRRLLRPRGGPRAPERPARGAAHVAPDRDALASRSCGEPTSCTVHAGCVGSVNADVTFHGRTGHAARPWEGENAIIRAAPFLDARRCASRRQPVEVDGLEFHDTLTVTTAAGRQLPATSFPTVSCSASTRASHPRRTADETRARHRAPASPATARSSSSTRRPPRAEPGERDAARLPRRDRRRRAPEAGVDRRRDAAGPGIPAVNFGPGEPGTGAPAGRVGRRGGRGARSRAACRVSRAGGVGLESVARVQVVGRHGTQLRPRGWLRSQVFEQTFYRPRSDRIDVSAPDEMGRRGRQVAIPTSAGGMVSGNATSGRALYTL